MVRIDLFMLLAAVMSLTAPVLSKAEDRTVAEQELLQIHEEDRRAHFNTDVDLLLSRSPEVFIMVNNAKIERVSRSQQKEMFTTYFRKARYYEWDDLEPPIVRVSKDATMGWIITRLKVRRAQADESGAEKERKFVYAGIMTYEKRDGNWVRVANVSTFESTLPED